MQLRRACIVVALVLVGCVPTGTDAEPVDPSPVLPEPSWSLPGYRLVYPGPPATVSIGHKGVLHIDAESLCVTLTDEGRGRDGVVAFSDEFGAIFDLSDPANPTLLVEGCRPLHDGDEVEFYGDGLLRIRESAEEYFDAADLQRCDATVEDIFAVGYCSGETRG